MKDHVCIVILNWNGSGHTMECLQSLRRLHYRNFHVFLLDNGSTDSSPLRLAGFVRDLDQDDGRSAFLLPAEPVETLATTPHITFVRSSANLGFAAGSNFGIRWALQNKFTYVWLLNNDTVVAPDTLSVLLRFLDAHLEVQGVTPQIRLYHRPDRTWHCGGFLRWWGARRYLFEERDIAHVPREGHRKVSFITGCAALFRAEVFATTGLLTERFFFGEEDYELCQRLKDAHVPLACVFEAVVYHKVSGSQLVTDRGIEISRLYIYYLNRFIRLRSRWRASIWRMWVWLYSVYIVHYMNRNLQAGLLFGIRFMRCVIAEAAESEGVTSKRFDEVMNHTRWGVRDS